ncbi:MAG TPA: efflux RND transporter permease subunit, partial [Polyangiales bacterium]|nr:efflux RND transporter permease subunit [Polyangiales bacterium]
MNLTAIAIRRPVFTVMVIFALVVLGLTGLSRLGTDMFPDVSVPVVSVNIVYPGASPNEVETLITKPIEDSVVSLNGIDRVVSSSRESLSTVSVLFKLGTNVEEAATQVRERVAQIRATLPTDIKEPAVSRIDTTAIPVLQYSVHSKRPLYQIRDFMDDVIRPALEQVDGVAQVNINGGAEREIHVDLEQAKLDALGLTPSRISQALAAGGMNVPAGRLTQGAHELSVRTVGDYATVDALRDLVVATAR